MLAVAPIPSRPFISCSAYMGALFKAAVVALARSCRQEPRASIQKRDEYVKRRKFSVPVCQQEVERDWAAQGFHCGAMIDPPGHEWNNFTHEANELVAVVEGRMRFTLLDEAFELEPGDEIFIPAGVPHSTKNIACTNSKWFYGYDGAANSWF